MRDATDGETNGAMLPLPSNLNGSPSTGDFGWENVGLEELGFCELWSLEAFL
jgi:hypothetical protein